MPTRVRILSALAITESASLTFRACWRSTRPLFRTSCGFLKNIGIVKCDRVGKVIFYSLKNEIVNDILLKGVEFLGY